MTLTALSQSPVRISRESAAEKARGMPRTFRLMSEDGSLSLSANVARHSLMDDTVVIERETRLPVFSIHPMGQVTNPEFDVLDADGHSVGRIKRHTDDIGRYWSIYDARGALVAAINDPSLLPQRAKAELYSDGSEVYAVVRGNMPIASFSNEAANRNFMRGIAKLLGQQTQADWVLRPRSGHATGIDGRLLLAASLMHQETSQLATKN